MIMKRQSDFLKKMSNLRNNLIKNTTLTRESQEDNLKSSDCDTFELIEY